MICRKWSTALFEVSFHNLTLSDSTETVRMSLASHVAADIELLCNRRWIALVRFEKNAVGVKFQPIILITPQVIDIDGILIIAEARLGVRLFKELMINISKGKKRSTAENHRISSSTFFQSYWTEFRSQLEVGNRLGRCFAEKINHLAVTLCRKLLWNFFCVKKLKAISRKLNSTAGKEAMLDSELRNHAETTSYEQLTSSFILQM